MAGGGRASVIYATDKNMQKYAMNGFVTVSVRWQMLTKNSNVKAICAKLNVTFVSCEFPLCTPHTMQYSQPKKSDGMFETSLCGTGYIYRYI
jgi:hypothetical protein